MSAREAIPSDERLLHAYHDGELGWLAGWRFERRLARSLEALDTLGGLARQVDAAGPAPDLWAEIARRLPGLDAERGASAGSGGWILAAPLLRPLATVAAAALLALAVAVGLRTGETGERAVGVVRWIDPGPHNVLVLEDEPRDATIIWVLDAGPEVSQGAGRDVA
jgi:anti-sigma-K factor RskA